MHAISPSQHRGTQDSPIHPQGQPAEADLEVNPLEEPSSWRLPAAITHGDTTDVKEKEIPFTD
jgi:hypothetical protein